MKALAVDQRTQRNFDSVYERDFDDLIWGRRAGHMGSHEFVDSAMPLWTRLLKEFEQNYYIPRNEIALIKKAGKLSASLLGNKPVTLVSRGCGTKFLEKEGTLIRYLNNIVGIVYLDRCEKALEQSIAEGRYLLPNAWHKTICADIYDPDLRYPVEGTEIGTSFGLTFMNIEGFPSALPPRQTYVRNLSAINTQMQRGAHFIVTLDHNQDAGSIEQAYAGQSDFAKHMISRTNSINPDDVDFIIKFDPASRTLFHGFQFKRSATIHSRSGFKRFAAKEVIWFNNSVKPNVNETKTWNMKSGFGYARLDIPMDHQNRLGWHHLIKPL